MILGTVMYSTSTSTDVSIINLDKISINMAELVRPATCTLAEFQRMWYEFEWENKINIDTKMGYGNMEIKYFQLVNAFIFNINIKSFIYNKRDLREYLKCFTDTARMTCLSNENEIINNYGFLSANLYARSIFGEDALVNLSAVKEENGYIKGSVRIRSQVQGIAVGLGSLVEKFHDTIGSTTA